MPTPNIGEISRMTATEELRSLLDKRGVEWDYGITGATATKFSVNGIDLTFAPTRDGLVCSTILTPEQAIATTLGRGECHNTNNVMKSGDFGFRCSECGSWDSNVDPMYCHECGCKVVDE